jgi:hypothetical protein
MSEPTVAEEETLDQKAARAQRAKDESQMRATAVANLTMKMLQEFKIKAMMASLPVSPETGRFAQTLISVFADVVIDLHVQLLNQTAEIMHGMLNPAPPPAQEAPTA